MLFFVTASHANDYIKVSLESKLIYFKSEKYACVNVSVIITI